jgi:hypothetical protein
MSWKGFTGEDKFEEAKEIFNNDISAFKKTKKEYETYIGMISDCLSKNINRINTSKQRIKGVLFVHLAEQLKWIKDVEIDDSFIKEIYSGADFINAPKFRQKSELFLIDFDEHSFKNNFLAIVTGGFLTRKKAEQTKIMVEEERTRLEEESVKLKTELNRLKKLNEVVKQIAQQLEELTDIYESMLVLLDNSIRFLMVKSIGFNHRMERVSIKNLPAQQQKEIVVLVAISHILNDIVNTSFTVESTESTIEDKEKELNILYNRYVEKYKEAA